MPQTLIIEAGHTERQYWRDLWRFRELFFLIAWRDFLIRYKQTVVGVAWALIRPFLTMLVLTLVMKIGKLPPGGVPAPLFVFVAMLPWQFFSTAMAESGNSLVNNSNLISKIYFPRLVVPARQRHRKLCGFFNLCGFSRYIDVLLSICTATADCFHSSFCTARFRCGVRRRFMDCSTNSRVPGFSLHRAFRRPIRTLRGSGTHHDKPCTG